MAIETLSSQEAPSKFTVYPLETASADLQVADVLLLAVDHFVEEVRAYSAPGGAQPSPSAFENSQNAQTLLGQLRDKINDAKVTIDFSVDAAIADNLPRS